MRYIRAVIPPPGLALPPGKSQSCFDRPVKIPPVGCKMICPQETGAYRGCSWRLIPDFILGCFFVNGFPVPFLEIQGINTRISAVHRYGMEKDGSFFHVLKPRFLGKDVALKKELKDHTESCH